MQAREYDLAGHGKNPNLVQLPLEVSTPRTELQIGDRVITKSFQGNAKRADKPLGKLATVRDLAPIDNCYLLNFESGKDICYWEAGDLELYEEPPLEHGFKIGDRVRCNHLVGEIFDTDYRSNPDWFYVAWDGQDNKFVAPHHFSDLKLETPPNISIELHDRLAELERERDLIRAIGPVALPKVWIEYGKVAKRKFRQAYYRSDTAIFPAKRQSSESGLVKRSYLGEENSKEVKAAGESIARRNRLDSIAREIKQIEKKLEEVDDYKRHPCN